MTGTLIDGLLSLDENKDMREFRNRVEEVLKLSHLSSSEIYLKENNIADVISMSSRALCHDDRDRVYGLAAPMPTEISARLYPDYIKPVIDVYHDFAEAVIHGTGSLDITFTKTSSSLEQSDIPSWVLDLSYSGMDSTDAVSTFSASGNRNHLYRSSKRPQDLFCQGIYVDEIDGLGCGYLEIKPKFYKTAERLHVQPTSKATRFQDE